MEGFPDDEQGEHVASSARGRRPWAGGWRWNGTSRPGGARTGPAAHVHRDVQAGGLGCALGDALRERGHRAEVDAMTDQAVTDLAPRVGVRDACAAVGAS